MAGPQRTLARVGARPLIVVVQSSRRTGHVEQAGSASRAKTVVGAVPMVARLTAVVGATTIVGTKRAAGESVDGTDGLIPAWARLAVRQY
jgi:hypothetical protein